MERGESVSFEDSAFETWDVEGPSDTHRSDFIGDYDSYEDYNKAHGFPEGSRPSVSGPRPVSRHAATETYDMGGIPNPTAPKWLKEAQKSAMAKSDEEAKQHQNHKKSKGKKSK